jgi:DNA-binding transcriptional ArsR family regulator
MKQPDSQKIIESEVVGALREALQRVPIIEIQAVILSDEKPGSLAFGYRPDVIADIILAGEPATIVCEVINVGHPRQVRDAVLYLQRHLSLLNQNAIGLVAAPYLSHTSQAICTESGMGFLDLAGNYRLAGDNFFLEHIDHEPPKPVKRALKSLFSPKSAQVLRTLLRYPHESWRVTELAAHAHVSLGHVSNVRSALIDREWASVGDDGVRLTDVDALLDAWREAYERPKGKRESYYTTLHGKVLEERLRALLHDRDDVLLASFSAAQWMAAYGRVGTTYLYATTGALPEIINGLSLTRAPSGANVEILMPEDLDILKDRSEPAPNIATTSPLQTYLDLAFAGERGQEAADHLRKEMFAWR